MWFQFDSKPCELRFPLKRLCINSSMQMWYLTSTQDPCEGMRLCFLNKTQSGHKLPIYSELFKLILH